MPDIDPDILLARGIAHAYGLNTDRYEVDGGEHPFVRHLAPYLTEIREKAKSPPWQPISTAPRNGTLVDLWVRIYIFTADGKRQVSVEFRAPDAQWSDQQWCDQDGNPHPVLEDFPDAEIEFWMQQPPAPPAQPTDNGDDHATSIRALIGKEGGDEKLP